MKKEQIIKIFNNLGFNISHNSKLGDLIELSPEDAFIFSSITGAPYLICEYGIGVKGRNEIFIHRSIFQDDYYIYTPGLFSRDINGKLQEGNSARNLLASYPAIFTGNKYVLIVEISKNKSSSVERNVYEDLFRKGIDPSNYILMKSFENNNASEPFLEYLAATYFIKRGYIVENQVPWFQQAFKYKGKIVNGGIPDFSAFKSSICGYLSQLGIIEKYKGISINLLPVLTNFRKFNKTPSLSSIANLTNYELILGEAKTDASSLPAAIKQLCQYKDVSLANKLYTIIPDVKNNGNDNVGEIFIENDNVMVNEAIKTNYLDKKHQNGDNEWINNYIKIQLLGNIDFEKLLLLIKEYRKFTNQQIFREYEAHHLIDYVVNLPEEAFFEELLRSI